MASTAMMSTELGFDVEFIDADGIVQRGPLDVVWRRRFENVDQVRQFPIYKGQSNASGARWSASTGRLVGFESRLERDRSMLLDFDPQVTAYCSQPFWLYWIQGSESRPRRHAPDFFVRLSDGSARVVDVRGDGRIKQRSAEAFAAAERACAAVGWEYVRVGVPEPVFTENVRWLSGYRRPLNMCREIADQAIEAFSAPRPLFEGAERAGMRIRVLPVVYHLMWGHFLTADLRAELLGPDTVVWASPRAGR